MGKYNLILINLVISICVVVVRSVDIDVSGREIYNSGGYLSSYNSRSGLTTTGNEIMMNTGSSNGNGNGNYGYTSSSTGIETRQGIPPGLNVMFGPSAPPPNNSPPPYSPYGFKDPGFSVQTGFEGYLVPNPWYSVIPWGIEGIVVLGVGGIFILALGAALLYFLLKIFRIGKLFRDDDVVTVEGEEEGRYLNTSFITKDNLNKLTLNVLDAIDKYNSLIREQTY